MKVQPIKTSRIKFGDNLENILNGLDLSIQEGTILAITSKIISVIEGRIINRSEISKRDLIRREADKILITENSKYDLYLTIKDGLLIPSAGIDESNADENYILYPSDPWKSAETIWNLLRTKFKIKNLGVIITDSHTTIMRRGVSGITLSWCGFSPLYSYVNKPDIYNQPLRVTHINIIDALASSAVFVMGEGNEQTPIALISDAPYINYLDRAPTEEEKKSVIISMEEDLYAPLLLSAKWD